MGLVRLLSFLSVSAGTWTALSLFRGFPACLLMPSTRQLLSRPHLHLETGPEVGCDLPKTTEHGGPRAGSGPDAPASPPAGALQWRDLSLGRAGCGARGEGGRAAGSSGASLPTRSGVSVSRCLGSSTPGGRMRQGPEVEVVVPGRPLLRQHLHRSTSRTG